MRELGNNLRAMYLGIQGFIGYKINSIITKEKYMKIGILRPLALFIVNMAIIALTTACASSAPGTITDTSFNLETRTVTLNNGIEMPIFGLGTYTLTPEQAENSVYHALMYGYRLIDTANTYMNERAVGRGIHRSGVPSILSLFI